MSMRIDVAEVIRRVGDGAQLVDALPASIYREEHLPSATNVALQTFDPDAVGASLDLTRPIVVYCFDQH
jgi:rhodanese-related sulfurtransferase